VELVLFQVFLMCLRFRLRVQVGDVIGTAKFERNAMIDYPSSPLTALQTKFMIDTISHIARNLPVTLCVTGRAKRLDRYVRVVSIGIRSRDRKEAEQKDYKGHCLSSRE